jgi:hypothetical protein
MRTLKSVGVEEAARLRRRARRALAMGRIHPEDASYITTRLDEVEARIVSMWEQDEHGQEES